MGYLIEYEDLDWYSCISNLASSISYDVNGMCMATTEYVPTTEIPTTSTSTTTTTTSTTTITTTTRSPSQAFVAPLCSNGAIGVYCNISADPCTMAQPCLNLATCFPNITMPSGYTCSCSVGFSGLNCEIDTRSCRPGFSCLYGGACNGSICSCPTGKTGQHCEYEIDGCVNIKCENNGRCVSTYGNWSCHCTNTELYSGTYCEIKSSKLRLKEIISRSFACVAIGCIATVISFVLIMDALKYIFHIDAANRRLHPSKENDKRRKKKKKIQKPEQTTVGIRFQYVHA